MPRGVDVEVADAGARLAGGSRAAGEPLIEARLGPPPLRPEVLPRDGLMPRLLGVRGQHVVTAIAPPGYGKTTTLALWRSRDPRPVAWVTADAGDADAARFLTYLAVAIDRAIGLEPRAVDLARATGRLALSTTVPHLVSAVHRANRPLVIMLDDVQLLAATPTLDAVTMLIDYLPPQVVVGLAGRRDPGLPLARYRAGGRLFELSPVDLALDEQEAALVAARAGHELRPVDARDLYARTEGWPAAVYLATLRAGRAGPERPAGPEGISGRDRNIAEYLDAELLDGVPADVRAFLVRTSVLDRMTGDLCDAVAERSDSAEVLRRLAAANQLVTPLDREGTWYRYHTLLGEHLRSLVERDRSAAASLHHRAAGWYAANGLPDLAIEHLFAAGDADAAAAQISDVALGMIRHGHDATVDRWIGRLGEDDLRRHPYLAVVAAWLRTLEGSAGEAARLLDLTEDAGYAGPRPAGADGYEDARAAVSVLHARHGLDAAIGEATSALEAGSRLNPWRPALQVACGAILTLAGEMERGRAILDEGAAAARAVRGGRAHTFALAWRGLLDLEREDWAAGGARAREALASAARYGYHQDATVTPALVVAARVALHRGEVAEARHQMASFQVARTTLGVATSWLSVRCLIEAATAHLGLADPAGARSCLQQAGDILIRVHDLGPLPGQLASMRERIRRLPPGPGGSSTLTPAEIRVLRLLPTYLTASEMADRLFVTPNTVRSQIQSLYGKLGATSRAEAVELAVEAGLLEPLPVLAPGGITSS